MVKKRNSSIMLALLLSIAMIFTMMPAMAWADQGDGEGDSVSLKVTQITSSGLAEGKYIIATANTEENSNYVALSKVVKEGQFDEYQNPLIGLPVYINYSGGSVTANATDEKNLVWTYEDGFFTNPDRQGDNTLYITDNTPQKGALKYQNEEPRRSDFDGSKLKAHDRNYYVTYDAESNFSTTTTANNAATIVMLKVDPLTVKFNVQGHGTAPNDETVEYGNAASAPQALSDELWTFGGWFKEAACTNAFDFATERITADTTLYAKWTAPYTVSFDNRGIGTAPAAKKVKADTAIGELLELTDPNNEYGFDGWFDKEGNPYTATTPVTADTTLYAKWTAYNASFIKSDGLTEGKSYVITANSNEKTYALMNTVSTGDGTYDYLKGAKDVTSGISGNILKVGSDALVLKYVKSGNNGYFVNEDRNNETHNMFYISSQGLKYQGKWTNGSSSQAPRAFVYSDGLMSSTASGNKTLYVQLSGETPEFVPSDADGTQITFYEKLQEYNVYFDMGGHGSAIRPETVISGQTATKPADPSAEGYTFDGWFDADGKAFDFAAPITADTTIYAKWTQVIPPSSFTVTFDVQGHGTAPEVQVVEKDAAATKPADPKADGMIFGGWFTDKECTKAYDFTKPVTENITLYAKWTIDPAAEVEKAKDAAVTEINKAVSEENLAKYKAAQQKTITDLVVEYTAKIKLATSTTEVTSLVAEFNTAIAAIPTAAVVGKIAKIGITIKSVKAGKRKVTVKWKAKKTVFNGYQIKYRIKGKKAWKSVTVKGKTKAKKVIKKLKKGKKYQAKVRGYKLYGVDKKIKVYGKFSKVKTSKKVK